MFFLFFLNKLKFKFILGDFIITFCELYELYIYYKYRYIRIKEGQWVLIRMRNTGAVYTLQYL